MVGLLVGIALGEGRIASLEDRATKYAPDLRDTAFANASISDLLRMSSGSRWSDQVVAGQATDIAELTAATYYRRGKGGASSLQRVRDTAAPPGTMFNYSSADTFALGLVLRGAIRGDLAAYAAEKLWQPLGAESAASWLTDSSGAEAAFCCINARLRDYGRLGLLLAHDGEAGGRQVVPREFLLDATDAARQPEYLKPRRATPFFGYGYQIWLYPYRTRTFQARGLFGQELIVQPSSRIVVVMTSALRTPDTPSEIFVERNSSSVPFSRRLAGKLMSTARFDRGGGTMKTSIAQVIQETFPGIWMNVGVDAHIKCTPPAFRPGVGLRPQKPEWATAVPGRVPVKVLEQYVPLLYAALYESVAAHARLGLNVVMDVGHHEAYSKPLRILPDCARCLAGLPVLFVGVRCPIDVLWARREATWGQVRDEVDDDVRASVHLGVEVVHAHGDYDLEVDTSVLGPRECAERIRKRLEDGPPGACFAHLARE